ncbi:DUF4136 domain-containing protein [Thalassomonas sp. M1454]|uniref:DUF4136 domain-containing protein n=1 Tax=Thalassomonas sp. M1454 TaxID=2594477 RepID=UPI00117D9F95|nr:DUF4136 domain-containing protein [Thalassomonas sp. M1454]TRX53150.1 DUF4136 domain-containing protein [Thalassomonas sp. M1454]
MKAIRIITIFTALLAVSACVTVEEAPVSDSQLVISSSFERDIELDENSTFAFTPLQVTEHGARYPAMTEAIEQFMAANSFKQVTPDQNPTFYIGYVLESEEDMSDDQLVESFGLNPGLPHLPELDKGTLLVFVLDGQSKQFVWKSAAQGFILDEQNDDERQLRIQNIVSATFNQFINKP